MNLSSCVLFGQLSRLYNRDTQRKNAKIFAEFSIIVVQALGRESGLFVIFCGWQAVWKRANTKELAPMVQTSVVRFLVGAQRFVTSLLHGLHS